MQVTEVEIARLKASDAKAQKQVFQLLYPKITSICMYYAGDTMLAEDAATAAFIKAFKSIALFDFQNINSFYAWVKKIAIREVLYELRKKRSFLSIDEIGEQGPSVESGALKQLQVQDIFRLVNQLPESQKAVFLMVSVDGYSHAECAEMLQISEANSKQLHHRAKEKLKMMLNAENKRSHGRMGN